MPAYGTISFPSSVFLIQISIFLDESVQKHLDDTFLKSPVFRFAELLDLAFPVQVRAEEIKRYQEKRNGNNKAENRQYGKTADH